MLNNEEILEKYSIKINDYNPNAFCLIKLELDEKGNPIDWRFLYCNDALAKLEGKTKEELLSKRFFEIFPDGNRKWLKYYYKAAYEGKVISFDELSEEIDQYLHIDAYPIGQEGICSCTVYDIKKEVYEKRQNDEQIAESHKMLEALVSDYLNVYVIEPETDSGTIIKLNGYVTSGLKEESKQFIYSKILHTYASNRVCDEDRDEFLEALLPDGLIKNFANGRERFELNYRVPVHENLEHYSGLYIRISKEDEPLKLIAGFRSIENVITLQNKTRDEGLYSAYTSVSNLFLAMFRVNVKENTYASIKTTDAVLKYTIPGNNRYDENLKAIITGLASEDSLSSALEFLDVNTIQERMHGKTHIATNFNGKVAGACRLHLIKENGSADNNLEHVILAVEVLDDNEFHPILDMLTENYWNVYWLDLVKDTAKVLKYMDGLKDTNLNYGQVLPYTQTVQAWIKNRVYEEDQDRLLEMMDIDYVRNELKDHKKFEGNYRRLIDGKLQNFQFSFTRVNNSDNVLVAFQNIDSIIEEHEKREKRERELEEAYLKNEKERTDIIKSLSNIYSTIIKVEIDTHHYEIFNSVSLMASVAGSSGNFDEAKDKILAAFMASDMQEEMGKFLDFDTLAERLKDVNTISMDYKAPSGQWVQARFVVKNRDENGVAKEALYVVRDITKEKLHDIEQQTQLSNALAAAQSANKAKSTFLNSMSHDIRTPMNAIIGFTALAQTHIDDKAQVEDYLSKISTSSTHLLSLINDILDMSRIESGTVKLEEKPVHIPELLHDLRTMIQGLVNSKNLNLFIDTQDVTHEDVITDKLRLNQVLINIVGNAIKFTQPGGDIIIRLVEKPCNVKHHTTYEFTVKDNGIGMSDDFQKHIFDSFARERSSTVSGIQGTGLGMAITKNIVDMMGGNIEVESEEGKGSIFTVTLTLRLANEPTKTEPIPELLGARALVVDDDLNTCRSVSKMLRDIDMRPDWTASGKEAVIRAQDAAEMKDEYKVYIIDYLMPDMNGIETVRRIKKVISEDVPIIVLTAYDYSDFEEEARKAGVTAFVSKPIFMSELREVLTRPVDNETTKKGKQYDYSGKHVLLVEDNELNREIATAILEETGMTIDTVNDGIEAVETMYKAPNDKYDLILMDIQMPKMDGYTATREIRTLKDNRKANIPIVAMTANAFEEDKRKALESGMNGHIIKPISIEEIAKVLDTVFEANK